MIEQKMMTWNDRSQNERYISWLKKRKSGIGGSDVGAILGLNKYKSRMDVYFEKTSDEFDLTDNPAMATGRKLEPFVRRAFTKESGYKVIKTPPFKLYHGFHKWQIASPDGLIVDADGFIIGIIEIKTTSTNIDDLPLSWLTQLAWYVSILSDYKTIMNHPIHPDGLTKNYIATLELPFRFDHYEFAKIDLRPSAMDLLMATCKYSHKLIDIDQSTINDIIDTVSEFWHGNVITRTPPAPMNVDDVMAFVTPANVKDDSIDAPLDIMSKYNEMIELKNGISAMTEKLKSLENGIKLYMNDHQVLSFNNETIATWKFDAPKLTFNSKKFQSENADIYHKYLTESKPVRRFLIK